MVLIFLKCMLQIRRSFGVLQHNDEKGDREREQKNENEDENERQSVKRVCA